MIRKAAISFLSLCLAVSMSWSILPQKTLASTGTTAGVKYVYDSTGKKRTGIEAISLEDKIYYDIEQGKGTTTAVDGNEIDFFKKVLTGNATSETNNRIYAGDTNLLTQWAELAEAVFKDNDYYSADINASGSFDDNFGKKWNQAGYTDLSKALSSTNFSSKGKERNDYTVVSGLCYEDNLKDVRDNACDQIRRMIKNNALWSAYDKDKNIFYTNTTGSSNADSTMKSLCVDKNQDVLYTMVTCVDDEGDTYAYHYNTFILAFYDFNLVPLAGDGLSYITNAEGYDSIEEASAAGAADVSYTTTEDDDPVISYYENKSKTENAIGLSMEESRSDTISNEFSSSKSYSFEETVGAEVEFDKTILPIADLKFKLEFKTGQVLSTAYSETKSVTNSSSMTVSSNLTLPAHTAVALENSGGKTDMTLGYKCPVGITYKVAIASMGGEVYADKAATLHWQTAGYTHKTFSTTFGCDSTKGGLTADENLYNRSISNINTAGFEESYGNTYGYRHRIGGDEKSTNKVNWSDILGSGTINPDKKVPYSIIYKEVDQKGKLTGVTLSSTDQTGEVDFEYAIDAPETYDYKTADESDQETTKHYELYTGNVSDENGNALDNSFTDGKKVIKLTHKYNQSLEFYYVNADSKDSSSGDASSNADSDVDDSSDDKTTNTPLSQEELKYVTKWLTEHRPLSSTGGKITYSAKSKSTSVGEIIPLYALNRIKLNNSSQFGDMVVSANGSDQYIGDYYDADALMDLTIYPGDKFLTKNVDLVGLDAYDTSYYGFSDIYGKWVAVKEGTDGNWVENTDTSIASLKTDSITGNQYVEAGEKEGTYYIQYFIDEKSYKSKAETDYTLNKNVTRPVIRLNVRKTPFKGSISLSGNYKGTVGEAAKDLNQLLNVFVTDEEDNRIQKDVLWEAKENKGIDLNSDGSVTFSSAGTYNIRACAEGKYSNWLTIEAIEEAKLTSISLKTPTFKKSEITLTDSHPNLEFDLDSYLRYYDQYGNEWNGAKPEVTFSLDDIAGGTIEGNILKVNKENVYTVYASANGYTIDPIDISVQDGRKVGEISISGNYQAVVGDAANDLNTFLRVTMTDAEGKEVQKSYTWDQKELNGINLDETGKITASKSGTYHVRAINEAGQSSPWYEITAVDPAISLNETNLYLHPAGQTTLQAKIYPDQAQKKNVIWTSSDSTVAKVDANGQITAQKTGSAVITASDDYGQQVTCQISVSPDISIASLKKSGKGIRLSWTKVANASAYEIYGNHCSGTMKLLKTVPASKSSIQFNKLNGKKLTKNCYKFCVKAYRLEAGKKHYLLSTPSVHIVNNSLKKYGNASKISVTSPKMMTVGSSIKLKSTVSLKKSKKQVKHVAAIRYQSSNPYVASVDKNGKITAKATGSCTIYAIAVNGKYAKSTITVK